MNKNTVRIDHSFDYCNFNVVVALEGENLKLMRKAMEGFKEIEMGMFSNLTEKKVAIDDGFFVLFTWSVENGI